MANMKPGWLRRRGSEFIAISLGVAAILAMWLLARRSDPVTAERIMRWGGYCALPFMLGVLLWLRGAKKPKS
jgi:hypothetical protein